jgi:hypothetical protein
LSSFIITSSQNRSVVVTFLSLDSNVLIDIHAVNYIWNLYACSWTCKLFFIT